MPKNYNQPALDTPVTGPRRSLFSLNGDAVGAGAEKVARFLGTGKYLAWQTLIVVVWICLNVGGMWWNWDPYPFILLNLAFSTQAAYAAPLILLAQNRQDDRDRLALNDIGAALKTMSTRASGAELAGVHRGGQTCPRLSAPQLDELRAMRRIEDKFEIAP